jgi:hypothetical protein
MTGGGCSTREGWTGRGRVGIDRARLGGLSNTTLSPRHPERREGPPESSPRPIYQAPSHMQEILRRKLLRMTGGARLDGLSNTPFPRHPERSEGPPESSPRPIYQAPSHTQEILRRKLLRMTGGGWTTREG